MADEVWSVKWDKHTCEVWLLVIKVHFGHLIFILAARHRAIPLIQPKTHAFYDGFPWNKFKRRWLKTSDCPQCKSSLKWWLSTLLTRCRDKSGPVSWFQTYKLHLSISGGLFFIELPAPSWAMTACTGLYTPSDEVHWSIWSFYGHKIKNTAHKSVYTFSLTADTHEYKLILWTLEDLTLRPHTINLRSPI